MNYYLSRAKKLFHDYRIVVVMNIPIVVWACVKFGWTGVFCLVGIVLFGVGIFFIDLWMEDKGVVWHHDPKYIDQSPIMPQVQLVVAEHASKQRTSDEDCE